MNVSRSGHTVAALLSEEQAENHLIHGQALNRCREKELEMRNQSLQKIANSWTILTSDENG
jgi:hypothetical protein